MGCVSPPVSLIKIGCYFTDFSRTVRPVSYSLLTTVLLYECKFSSSVAFRAEETVTPVFCASGDSDYFGGVCSRAPVSSIFSPDMSSACSRTVQNVTSCSKQFQVYAYCWAGCTGASGKLHWNLRQHL